MAFSLFKDIIMKDNNKNRKLNFIRKKNKLRLGIEKYNGVVKISADMDMEYAFACFIEQTKKQLLKEYKLSLRHCYIREGYNCDYFVKGTKTLLCVLHN